MGDYKTSKEAFVTGMTGSTITHINMVSLVALSSVALHSALRSRLPETKLVHFSTEFLILVIPLLLSVTLFANTPGLLSFILLFPAGLLLLIPPQESGTPLPSSLSPSRAPSPSCEQERLPSTPPDNRVQVIPIVSIPALTTYRAHMLLLTSLCILAVDFPVFPRILAKCERFGVSIMDLGVGSFVFSQGLVSAIPLVKNPSYLTSPLLPKLYTVLRKCLPLLLLGLLRTISVKSTEYPEHQTEYGTHWNFFITLAAVSLLQTALHPFMVRIPMSLLGFIVALLHQYLLSQWGVMNYVFHAPRDNIISHNKEGIVSLSGYLAIHVLGLFTGTLLLPPSPSYFRRGMHGLVRDADIIQVPDTGSDTESDDDVADKHRQGSKSRTSVQVRRENDKTAIELFSYAAVWWLLLGFTAIFGVGGGVSRVLVNLPYIFWVAAFNTTFLLGYLLLDLFFFPSPLSKSVYSPTSKLKIHLDSDVLTRGRRDRGTVAPSSAPALLEAFNRNGLVLFLLANVSTGLVNLTIPTMYVRDGWAMLILSTYAVFVCSVAWVSRERRLWKF